MRKTPQLNLWLHKHIENKKENLMDYPKGVT